MNRFGRMFSVMLFGESHGPSLGIVIDGCPPGISFSEGDMKGDLSRRKSGGKGTTSRCENDIPVILSGVFNGMTTGTPIALTFSNNDCDSIPYEAMKTTPRPGHADMTAHQKYRGYNDFRGGGHFSGRLTVAIVAAGVLAKKIIGGVIIKASITTPDIDHAVDKALSEGDSVGAIIECRIANLPAGLGEPFFDSVESLLAHALFSIPGVKGVEFGAGFAAATMRGSEYNDDIISAKGKTATNNSGGINGGITNGNDVLFRIVVRPTASILKKQSSVNIATGERADIEIKGRHDACIALRMPVIVEAMAAIVIADLMMCQE